MERLENCLIGIGLFLRISRAVQLPVPRKTIRSIHTQVANLSENNWLLPFSRQLIQDENGVTVVSILGTDYSIKAPAGEEITLLQATGMLKKALAETKRRYPTLIGDRLLVLAALNLCSQQIEMQQQHREELDRCREQVDATVDVISKTIAQG